MSRVVIKRYYNCRGAKNHYTEIIPHRQYDRHKYSECCHITGEQDTEKDYITVWTGNVACGANSAKSFDDLENSLLEHYVHVELSGISVYMQYDKAIKIN
jgi:hypothetical protein